MFCSYGTSAHHFLPVKQDETQFDFSGNDFDYRGRQGGNDNVASSGTWTNAVSNLAPSDSPRTLRLFVNLTLPANTQHSFSFTVVNPAQGQAASDVSVQAVGVPIAKIFAFSTMEVTASTFAFSKEIGQVFFCVFRCSVSPNFWPCFRLLRPLHPQHADSPFSNMLIRRFPCVSSSNFTSLLSSFFDSSLLSSESQSKPFPCSDNTIRYVYIYVITYTIYIYIYTYTYLFVYVYTVLSGIGFSSFVWGSFDIFTPYGVNMGHFYFFFAYVC